MRSMMPAVVSGRITLTGVTDGATGGTANVPEPGTLALLGTGLAGLAAGSRAPPCGVTTGAAGV